MSRLNNFKITVSSTTIITLIITVGLSFIVFSPASHAELRGNYQFQDTLSSSTPPAPPLVDLGTGQFIPDVVNGENRQVFNFNLGEGLRLDTTGVIANNFYTIVVLFKFDDLFTEDYQRILDFQNFATDEGLYVNELFLNFYDEASSAGPLFTEDTYAQVVLTRNSAGNVIGYFNGTPVLSFNDTSDFAVISNDNFLTFFQDDSEEDSAGCVACIIVYDEVLPPQQIASLDCFNPTVLITSTVPTLS